MTAARDLIRRYVSLAVDWWTPPTTTNQRIDQVYGLVATEERERIIADIVGHCPDHGDKSTMRLSCHCAIADELRRKPVETG